MNKTYQTNSYIHFCLFSLSLALEKENRLGFVVLQLSHVSLESRGFNSMVILPRPRIQSNLELLQSQNEFLTCNLLYLHGIHFFKSLPRNSLFIGNTKFQLSTLGRMNFSLFKVPLIILIRYVNLVKVPTFFLIFIENTKL